MSTCKKIQLLIKKPKQIKTYESKQDNQFHTDKICEKINIVYLCPKECYNTKMDRNRFHSMCAISKLMNTLGGNVTTYGFGWDGFEKTQSLNYNLKKKFPRVDIDLIIIYHPKSTGYDYIGIKDLPIYKCTTYNEMFNTEKIEQEINDFEFDFVICHHSNEMDLFKTKFPSVMFFHIPHCAEMTVFRPLNINKIYDFVVVGNCSKSTYPLRCRFRDIIIPKLINNGFKCHIHIHPGYVISNAANENVVKEYVEIINKAKIVLTCSSKYYYLLSKFVEIPMCGTAMVSDMPFDNDELSKYMITVNMNMKDEEILNKLQQSLHNYTDLAAKGRTYVMTHRTQEHYANMFMHTFNDFLTGSKTLIIKKSDMLIYPILDLTNIEISRHSVWLPDLCIKIPYQKNGKITKNIQPMQNSYDLTSIAHEYTIFNVLAQRNMAPCVGRIVFYEKIIHKDRTIDDCGAYGFEMENAEKIKKGTFSIDELCTLPIQLTPSAKGDILKDGNIINGHLIDVRSTCQFMMLWTDTKSLVRIEGINI